MYKILTAIIHNLNVFTIIFVSFIEFGELLRKDDNDTGVRIFSLGAYMILEVILRIDEARQILFSWVQLRTVSGTYVGRGRRGQVQNEMDS